MSCTNNRVSNWVITGLHRFEGPYAAREGQSSDDGKATNHIETFSGGSIYTSHNSSPGSLDSQSEPAEMLIGSDNDLLIPSTEDIKSTFLRSRDIWHSYVASADMLALGYVPAVSLDSYSLIWDMPPFPQNLEKKQFVTGRALWSVSCPEIHESCHSTVGDNDAAWNPEHVHGANKYFHLTTDMPTRCKISTRPDFLHFTDTQPHSRQDSNGIAILVLMWSYILSARLLEMQKRCIHYSTAALSPVSNMDKMPKSGFIVYTGDASKKLVRWLCAILVQGSGWHVKGRSPPWAAHYEGDIRFTIATNRVITNLQNETAPSSTAATDLLIEFCQIHSFGSQPLAAFSAALLLPFHNNHSLKPRLPLPRIAQPKGTECKCSGRIRDYYNDLPYYITFSICPLYLGSALWSIFWEPGIQCNLASAWLGSIHQVIKPLLDAGDFETLAKVFAFRRPRLAPLWLGVCICGCPEVIEMIESYLMTLEEQPLFPTLAYPDPDVAAWTGSYQSFFDETTSGPYIDLDADVPRADLLRYRFDFRLGDSNNIVHFGWQPFGTMKKAEIEPELWSRLECQTYRRKYVHWVWWINKDTSIIEPGFRHGKVQDKSCFAIDLRSNLSDVVTPSKLCFEVRLAPSKEATFRISVWGSMMASGDRSIDAIMPGTRNHPWFADGRLHDL